MASGFHNRVFDEEQDEEPYQRRKNDERDFQLEKSPPSRRQVSSLVEDEPTVQGRMDNLGFEPNGSPVFKTKVSDSDGQRERTTTGVSPVISSNNKSKTNEGFEKDEYEPTNGYAAGNNVQPSYGEVSDKPVTESTQDAPVYKRRWYILTVFSLIAFTQGCVWNAFGPISSTSQYVFKWSNGDIALINNWVFISYFVGGVFFSWMLDVKGMKIVLMALLSLFIYLFLCRASLFFEDSEDVEMEKSHAICKLNLFPINQLTNQSTKQLTNQR